MQTKKKSILDSNVLYTVIAIIVGFIIGAIFLAVAGISPAVAYGKLIDSVFGTKVSGLDIDLCKSDYSDRSECCVLFPYRCV